MDRATLRAVQPPPDIPAGGDVDATEQLAAWIGAQPPGSTLDLGGCEGRTYRIDRSLQIVGAIGLTVRNARFTVAAPSAELDSHGRSLRRHLWFRRCTYLTLTSVSVTGQNTTDDDGTPAAIDGQAAYDPKREWEHALAIEDSQRVTVTQFTADAIYGDGIYWRRVAGGHLQWFRVSRNGRQGVAVVAGTGLRLLHGEILHSRRSGIDLEPNAEAETIEDVEIGHVGIRSRLIPLTAGGPGTVSGVYVHDIDTTSRTVPTLSLVPHSGGRRDRWTVERWRTRGPLGSPQPIVRAANADELVLRDFEAPAAKNRAMVGVSLTNAGRVELTGAQFPGAAQLVTSTSPAENHTLTVDGCAP